MILVTVLPTSAAGICVKGAAGATLTGSRPTTLR